MSLYEERILTGLLDSYERSLLFKGENKVSITITYPFNKKNMPEYLDTSSMEYEDIHAVAKELEYRGFLKINWKNGKRDHIIKDVTLNINNLEEIYRFCKRTPKKEQLLEQIQLISTYQKTHCTPVVTGFTEWLLKRLRADKTVKEYLDISNGEKTEELLHILSAIEENQTEIYLREFSVLQFQDTKKVEKYLGKIEKIMQRFHLEFADKEITEILAEYQIYQTSNYVYLKGKGTFLLGENHGLQVNLSSLKQGIGISGDDFEHLSILDDTGIKQVITIENKTSFFRWNQPDSLLIYLGGYHNSVRRALLLKIYKQLPNVSYLHFGDIDVGGFLIYKDLCEKTGIPFKTWNMGIKELELYREYGKPLTENDKIRLKKLRKKSTEDKNMPLEVLEYMQEKEIKLEQECILPEAICISEKREIL